MKTETLTKIAIASLLGASASCAVERGVIIEIQDLPYERALYVNLLNKHYSKPMSVSIGDIYVADRKLFFNDTTYMAPFKYAMPGDTIEYKNPLHRVFLDMDHHHAPVRRINGVSEKDMIRMYKSLHR